MIFIAEVIIIFNEDSSLLMIPDDSRCLLMALDGSRRFACSSVSRNGASDNVCTSLKVHDLRTIELSLTSDRRQRPTFETALCYIRLLVSGNFAINSIGLRLSFLVSDANARSIEIIISISFCLSIVLKWLESSLLIYFVCQRVSY